jgi:hypothetical protein
MTTATIPRVFRLTLTTILLCIVRRPAAAQRPDSTIGAATRDAGVPSAMRPVAMTRGAPDHAPAGSRIGHAAHDGLIGAAIGTAAALVTALILASNPSVTDHSEDGSIFFALGLDGAMLGLIIGAVVGLVRSP